MSYVPRVVHFDLTGACNFTCIHCRGRCSTHTLSKEKVFLILDQLFLTWPNSVQWFELGGGEPLLVKHLEEIIKYIKERSNAKVLVVSNGSLFTSSRAISLKDAGLDRVQFSLDGSCADSHNYVRNNSFSYTKVMEAIHFAKSVGIPFVLRMSILKKNVDEVETFVQLAKSLGAAEVGIRGCVYSGDAQKHIADTFIEPQIYSQILSQFEILSQKYSIPIFSGDPLALVHNTQLLSKIMESFGSYEHYGGCMIGLTYLYINNDGNIAVCPMLNEIIIGDPLVFGFKELWDSHPFFIQNRNRDMRGKCGSCKYKFLCGGCRAQSYWATKDLFGENPICRINGGA